MLSEDVKLFSAKHRHCSNAELFTFVWSGHSFWIQFKNRQYTRNQEGEPECVFICKDNGNSQTKLYSEVTFRIWGSTGKRKSSFKRNVFKIFKRKLAFVYKIII